ncbi:unnamed protein product [Arabidopsis halleri]
MLIPNFKHTNSSQLKVRLSSTSLFTFFFFSLKSQKEKLH